jgi:Asp/Glu/hydantoin racemase
MSTPPRIALIHATRLSMEPVTAAFNAGWPEARLMNVLDDTLTADLVRAGRVDRVMMERFEALAKYVVEAHADAILFTCSAFAPAIERAAASRPIPVLKPNQAMFSQALDRALAGERTVGLITTFAPASVSMRGELLQEASRRGIELRLEETCVPEAMDALDKGDVARHDELICAAAVGMRPCDALMLGQFSMARAAPGVQAAVASPVLTSPRSAVVALRKRFE